MLLNVYWEPGVTDIQKSRYFFSTELWDKDELEERYPQLKDKLKGKGFVSTKFLYDDSVNTENKHTAIEVYYHKYIMGKNTLQYCRYVGDQVIYATENDTQRPTKPVIDPMTGQSVLNDFGVPVLEEELSMAERGLYDHGKYPYFFDALFPIEGSPCGYGYVDICLTHHRAYGSHRTDSAIWWNGPDGFTEDRRSWLPTVGPHDMVPTDAGDILNRTPEETYLTPAGEADHILCAGWTGQIPEKTWVNCQIRTADTLQALATAPFLGPDGTENTRYEFEQAFFPAQIHGRFFQLKLYLGAVNSGSSPRIAEIYVK